PTRGRTAARAGEAVAPNRIACCQAAFCEARSGSKGARFSGTPWQSMTGLRRQAPTPCILGLPAPATRPENPPRGGETDRPPRGRVRRLAQPRCPPWTAASAPSPTRRRGARAATARRPPPTQPAGLDHDHAGANLPQQAVGVGVHGAEGRLGAGAVEA